MVKIYNDIIIDNLNIIYEYELFQNNTFKANAYKKVITNIRNYEEDIKTIEDIKNIDNVGKSILEKITELMNTGKLELVETILLDDKFILSKKLLNIYGIGPSKIKELISKITTFDELYLETNKKLLNDKQQIGLKYYDDLQLRIPYIESKKHYTFFKTIINNINKEIIFDMVGSFRRKSKTIGDIDIIIKYNPGFVLKDFIKKLFENGYLLETLANGKNKFMGICKLNPLLPARRLDILVTNEDNYYFALLYFTGSYKFNIYMRNVAIKKGLSLSEYGFKDIKTSKLLDTTDIIKSEKDIFDYLEIPYVAPEKRL